MAPEQIRPADSYVDTKHDTQSGRTVQTWTYEGRDDWDTDAQKNPPAYYSTMTAHVISTPEPDAQEHTLTAIECEDVTDQDPPKWGKRPQTIQCRLIVANPQPCEAPRKPSKSELFSAYNRARAELRRQPRSWKRDNALEALNRAFGNLQRKEWEKTLQNGFTSEVNATAELYARIAAARVNTSPVLDVTSEFAELNACHLQNVTNDTSPNDLKRLY